MSNNTGTRNVWFDAIDEAIDERFARMIEVRRWLHAHPEPSGQEVATTRFLEELLIQEGLHPRAGSDGRGLLCDGTDRTDLPMIALRADVDALRIHDGKQVPYRSQNPGIMHACGHDAHSAILFGTVSALRHLQRTGRLAWPIRYRAIFQPAEETCEGAQQMIAAGALEGVSAIVALHVDPTREVGHIGIRTGVLTANCDEMRIVIRGRGGHAARPHETSDPIAAAAQLINSLYLHIPRVTDSQEAVVVTIGQVHGGDNANVIPEEVELRGTIRSLDRAVRQHTMDHVRRLAFGVGQMTLTKITVDFGLGCNSVCNDADIADLLRSSGKHVLGEAGVLEIARPSMGSEDFAFYLDRVPGAMLRLGCVSQRSGRASLHTPDFDIDEEALRIGAKVMARAVVQWCDPDSRVPPRPQTQTPEAGKS